ncbi:hypothetical protein [Caballeronia grimmiae]|uniref:hypothetical protein n=1 Tax=Caballeronia grimmiae TaxID=1071679 RepID=UPI0038BCEB61
MDDCYEIKKTEQYRQTELTSKLFDFLELVVADAACDVEVVARELGLNDEMRERLRRALDRVGCARGVLEAMREGKVRTRQKARTTTNHPMTAPTLA